MQYAPTPLAYGVVIGTKLAGYVLAAGVLARSSRRSKTSLLLKGAARTAGGVVLGVATVYAVSGLFVQVRVDRFLDDSAALAVLGLAIGGERVLHWRYWIRHLREGARSEGETRYSLWATGWSFLLDGIVALELWLIPGMLNVASMTLAL